MKYAIIVYDAETSVGDINGVDYAVGPFFEKEAAERYGVAAIATSAKREWDLVELREPGK